MKLTAAHQSVAVLLLGDPVPHLKLRCACPARATFDLCWPTLPQKPIITLVVSRSIIIGAFLMNDSGMLFQPLLTGLSTGAFCVGYCYPFVAPYLIAEERSGAESLSLVLKFLAGRFLGYVLFGGLAGLLGRWLDNEKIQAANSMALVVLSVILFAYLIGIAKQKETGCVKAARGRTPLVMGFLLGVNVCPPFLLSLGYVFSHKSPVYGIIYFTLFFISSSVYFLPFFLTSWLSRMREMRFAARVSGFVSAAIFIAYAVHALAVH